MSVRASITGAVLALLAVAACSAPDRVAVAWSDLVVADDRTSLTVTTWYPGHCIKVADGVDVDGRDGEVIVSAFMRRADGVGARDECTLECASVTQRVTFGDPLPDLPIRPPDDHRLGCGS